ncbi:MAG: lactate dehydrogenase [Clostridium sp.]|jgi:malate/lactate dehydrogenase|nr:lactate dehydrogenase [Clostridium sp.]
MKHLILKKELLAYVEYERKQGTIAIYDFLKDLPSSLKNDVNELLHDGIKMEDLHNRITRHIKDQHLLIMILDEKSFPSRWIATTLSELLEITGPELIVSNQDYLGFEVLLVHKNDPYLKDIVSMPLSAPFRASLMGLGDVGGTLLMGLRLLGKDTLSEIKIYDRNENKRRRYYLEINEISDGEVMPPVIEADLASIFQTDVFIFTVSAHIPPLGTTLTDVRMVQFEKNKEILLDYVKQAEESGFTGYYFIVSDPVDLLCMAVMNEGNIPSHRIRGFGLGVMEARARFIAKENEIFKDDLRTFGPHGKGLVVINSLSSYNDELSLELTNLTEKENFRVRETGFKPYIAPALSSGAISILKALRGDEHLSTVYNGYVFMGSRTTLRGGFTLPSKVSLKELTPLLSDTQALLDSLYKASLG